MTRIKFEFSESTKRGFASVILALVHACGPLSDAAGTQAAATDPASPATQSSTQTAIYVAAGTPEPECTQAIVRQIAYFESESAFKYCTGKVWQTVDLRGPSGQPGNSSPILVTSTPEPAGANCFYGGEKFSLGNDSNSNNTLDEAEATGSFFRCDNAISKGADNILQSYLYSIGLVRSTYRFTGLCNGVSKTHERDSSGTAWAYDFETFVTNAHVATSTTKEDCDSDGLNETTFYLAEIKIYLPKTSIPLSTWLTKGPTYSPTHASQTEYDVLTVTSLDRRAAAAASPAVPTDIADAMLLKVPSHGRAPIPVSTASQDSPGTQSVRIGEQLVLIAHPAARSSTMSIGSLMSMQSCAEWWQTDSSLLSIFFTENEFCKRYHSVSSSRRMITSMYAEHGSSGGPVFNRFGNVTGMETWGSIANEVHDYGAVQQIAYVRPWLQMAREWSNVATPVPVAWQNVTVTDPSYKQMLTGKEWTKILGNYTWADAITRCGDPTNKWGSGFKTGTINAYPGYNGKQDWRMPSLGELRTAYSGVLSTLDSASYTSSSITAPPAPNPVSDSIKSITNAAFLNGYTWGWTLSGATNATTTSDGLEMSLDTGSLYSWPKTLTDKVICVRGP